MANKASGDDELEFRDMLARIARRIDEYSLEDLKYQCRGFVGAGKLEQVIDAKGLFDLLEERDELDKDNVEFLTKIFENVGRNDLRKVVQDYSLSKSRTSMLEPMDDSSTKYTSSDNAIVSDHDAATPVEKTVDVTREDKEGQNSTVPFETSRGGMPPIHIEGPQFGAGYAYSPELQRALDYVINHISRGWQIAARHLGVPDVVIEDAEYNWPRQIRSQISDVFRYWARSDTEASVRKLIAALRHVRRNDLADRLQSDRF